MADRFLWVQAAPQFPYWLEDDYGPPGSGNRVHRHFVSDDGGPRGLRYDAVVHASGDGSRFSWATLSAPVTLTSRLPTAARGDCASVEDGKRQAEQALLAAKTPEPVQAAAASMVVRDVAAYPEWTCDWLDDFFAQDFSAVVRIQKTDLPRLLGVQQRVVERMPLSEVLLGLKRYCAGDRFLRDVEPLLQRPLRIAIDRELTEQEDDRSPQGALDCFVEEILEQPHFVSVGGAEEIVTEIRIACTGVLAARRGGVVTAAARKRKRKKKVKAAEPMDPRLNLDSFQVTPHELQRKIGDMTPYLP